MIVYIVFDTAGDEYERGTAQELPAVDPAMTIQETTDALPPSPAMLVDNVIVARPAPPDGFYMWDATSRGWVLDSTALAAALLTEVQTLLGARTYASIDYSGDLFDADPVAREAISETYESIMRGEGLPDGWVGWRDSANEMHWVSDLAVVVGAHLKTIRKSIIDRHQGLIKAGWTHTDAIRALAAANDATGLLSYDVTTGWP